MQKITVLTQKLWIYTPPYFSSILASQLVLRSNERSNSNFDCRNGFLEVDYIGLDTLHEKIGHFTEKAGGGQPPPTWGGPTPIFFPEIKIHSQMRPACRISEF